MSIDAAAARREARRRKILENSTNRLTKILGQSESLEGERTVDNSITTSIKSEACNGAVLHKQQPVLNNQNENLRFNERISDGSDSPIFSSSEGGINKTANGTQGNATQKHTNRFDDQLLWIIFHTLLGLIVRFMFEFNLGVLFADSLCMPFITMSVAKYMSNPDSIGDEHGASGLGLVRLALMMSGISQTALDKIFRWQTIILNIAFDFSLYFFSFTIAHEFFNIMSR